MPVVEHENQFVKIQTDNSMILKTKSHEILDANIRYASLTLFAMAIYQLPFSICIFIYVTTHNKYDSYSHT